MTTIRPGTPEDHETLLGIWRRSVEATHTFLTAEDIRSLLPEVRERALPALELWVVCDDGTPAGFMGMAGDSVEALFIAPEAMRRGLGRRLLDHARGLRAGPLKVDVNEQNAEAVKFYQACGFGIVGRSPVDSAGRPFPLLHLEEATRR